MLVSLSKRNNRVQEAAETVVKPAKNASIRVAVIVAGEKLTVKLAMLKAALFKGLAWILVFLMVNVCVYWYVRKMRSEKSLNKLKIAFERQSDRLRLADEERDWLLKEIHHRVKNNLQIIMSLLNTQSAYLTNPAAIEAIRNSQHRMYAISLVHQKLYQMDSASSVDMVTYVHELANYLKDAYGAEGKIAFLFDLVPLHLHVNMALPLGLIINEAINNSLKYAFPGDAEGDIRISLKSSVQGVYSFRIADNGVGLQRDYDLFADSSFGRNLMAGLADQLGGTYEINNHHGVEIVITFNTTTKV